MYRRVTKGEYFLGDCVTLTWRPLGSAWRRGGGAPCWWARPSRGNRPAAGSGPPSGGSRPRASGYRSHTSAWAGRRVRSTRTNTDDQRRGVKDNEHGTKALCGVVFKREPSSSCVCVWRSEVRTLPEIWGYHTSTRGQFRWRYLWHSPPATTHITTQGKNTWTHHGDVLQRRLRLKRSREFTRSTSCGSIASFAPQRGRGLSPWKQLSSPSSTMKNSPLVLLHTRGGRPTHVWTSNALVLGFITLIFIYIYIYLSMTSPVGSHSSVTFSSTRAAVRFTNGGAARRWLALAISASGEFFFRMRRIFGFAQFATTRVRASNLLIGSSRAEKICGSGSTASPHRDGQRHAR